MFMIVRVADGDVVGTAWDASVNYGAAVRKAEEFTELEMGVASGEPWVFEVRPVTDLIQLADLVGLASYTGPESMREPMQRLDKKLRDEYWAYPEKWGRRPEVGTVQS